LNGSQFHWIVFVLIALFGTDCILIYFTQSCGDRCQNRSSKTFGDLLLRLLQTLSNLLPCPINVHIVFEDYCDHRQSKAGKAAELKKSGNVVIYLLNGKSY